MGISLDPQTAATALGVILLAVGALMSAPSLVTSVGNWLQEEDEVVVVADPDAPDVSSNPICVHVQMVIDTAYSASPEVQLEYLKKGMTRTSILESEVARLCKGPA